VDVDVTGHLLISFIAFVRYWRKYGSIKRVYQIFVDFKKACDSVGWEVLYDILIEFGVPIKLYMRRLIEICLKKIQNKFSIGKNLSENCCTQNIL
jgi:hypothetical protein